MKQPATLHGWIYGQNSPVVYTDLTGHQAIPPASCPCSPTGKYWKYIGMYRLSAYGHPVHERFALVAERRNRDATQQRMPEPWPKKTLKWRDAVNPAIVYNSEVSSLWLEHLRPETGEGTAGKLESTIKGTVFIKCARGQTICSEKTEEKAKTGAAGIRLRPYKSGAINPLHNKDLVLGDTVYIEGGAGIVTIRDHGGGQPHWTSHQKATWIDIYIGEHGYHDWDKTILKKNKVWALRDLEHPLPCDWDIPYICPR